MAVYAADWPPLLIPSNAEFFPDTQSVSGGRSISGVEQIVRADAGRWRARLDIPVRGEERVLALRAFLGQLEGRLGTALVPKWDRYRPRDANGRRLSELGTAAYDGCELNFDLSGLGQDETALATVAEAASRRGTEITVALGSGIDGPRPGQYFGLGRHIYIVQQTWQAETDDNTTVRFWPPLREDVAADTEVILDRPVCLMRLDSDDSGQAMLSWRRSGVASLEFVEVL